MPLQTEEQKVRRPSDFIKLEDGDVLVIQSNVYDLTSHYLQNEKTGVLCGGENCYFCQQDIPQRKEFYYFGKVNDVVGFIRVPASVFYSLNGQERLIQKAPKNKDKDKRNYEWVIGKTGSGLETEYTVAKGDGVDRPTEAEMEVNNKKLVTVCEKYERSLGDKSMEIVTQDTQAEEQG